MAEDRQERFQKHGENFYKTLGLCIAEWARVDDALFRIFRDCLGPHEQSAIIYYRSPSLDARFGLTNEIVRSVLPKRQRKSGGHDHPAVKAWVAAHAGYKDLLAVRRRVAHHPVGMMVQGMGALGLLVGEPPDAWFVIDVGQHERARVKESNLKAMTISDLHRHQVAVANLRDRLHGFLQGVLIKHAQESLSPNPLRSPG